MRFLPLTLLFSLLNFSVDFPASDSSSSDTKVPVKAPEAANIVLQSKDGGKTWQDISQGLPEIKQPEGFFAGASEIYLNINGVMYRSESNLKTPVWEKENVIDKRSTIAFNGSEVLAYSFNGSIYQKKATAGTWMPIYTNLKSTNLERHEVATIFEAADGTVFKSTGKSFAKSTDKARSWKLIPKGGVGEIVEAEGVLLAAGQKGIMRSTDRGENWEWVISEGGAGIDLEHIDGGFAAIAYNTQTKSRRIHTSLDGGKTWQVISEGLPSSPNISSVKQIGSYIFVGHPDGIFRSSDMGKTWLRVHSGFGNANPIVKLISWDSAPAPVEKVFKLHVSGNVLYAVAVAPGC